jgi:hypothetical protein
MAPVNEDKTNGIDLAGAVVRLCPACGVVNPAGPSAGCPHLQLIRFDGVTPELAELLRRVAEARREYNDLAGRLREHALAAVHQGRAAVETVAERSRRPETAERPRPRAAPERLALESPQAPRLPADQAKARPRRRSLPAVDARQLDLLARGPAKGEA